MYSYLMYQRGIKTAAKHPINALTQEDLNKLHQGPDFQLDYSYAQLVATIFVCLTFSTGMPILYAVATVSTFIQSIQLFDLISCFYS